MKPMDRGKITDLILAYYIGETTPQQQQELEKWLETSPKNRELFNYILDLERIRNKQSILNLFDQQKAWNNIYHNTIKLRRQRLYINVTRYAALILLLIGVGTYWVLSPNNPHPENRRIALSLPADTRAILSYRNGPKVILTDQSYSVRDSAITTPQSHSAEIMTVTVPRGGEFQLILDDGTKVWLNSGTELRFPGKFGKGKREVNLLAGEAYFKVAKDSLHPFLVHSQEISVEVLGTEFNLQNYQDEQSIITTLVEGSVRLSSTKQALKPGEQSSFNKGTRQISTCEVNTGIYTAWKDGRFIFKSIPLENILRQLSRWYNVRFEYEDEILKSIPFSGNIRKYEDGNTILKILESTGRIHFTEQNDVIYVRK